MLSTVGEVSLVNKVGGWWEVPRCKCRKTTMPECWLLVVMGTHT